jgi:TolB-like protein
LTQRRAIIDNSIAAYRGRIANTAGDSVLAEFGSAVDAVRCAVEAQVALAQANGSLSPDRHINFRIGVHVGDVMVKDGDLFGDGVNIAARLEGIAEPGGVCISNDAYRQVRGKVEIVCDDMGPQSLKNIAEPMQAWRIRLAGQTPSAVKSGLAVSQSAPLSLPDEPSIAVLPFQNMSGDPEQEYFADGMVEDIITALSRFKSLFVIARNSSFTYKGKAVDIKQVGRELGVRYVLEGSVRKAANRVRITGQLIDAATGAHLWADRFDGPLVDIFDLQDQVTTSVVSAIAPKLERAEIERAKRKPTENLDAYDCFLRGIENLHQRTEASVSEALRLFYQAIELDPQFASAYGMAERCYTQRQAYHWMTDRTQEIAETARLARKAIEFGKDDAVALCAAADTLVHDFDAGMLFNDRARQINPNLASAWYLSGWLRVWLGEHDLAIKHFAQFKRMSPLDPFMSGMHSGTAVAHAFAGRFEDAVVNAALAFSESPNSHQTLRAAVTSYALAGRVEQAQEMMSRLRQIDPTLRISNLKDFSPLRRPEDIERYAEAMRKAGLPA